MAQLYFGTNPDNLQAYGLPIDERVEVTNPNIGWALYENEDPELNRQRDKDMRNKGYMMGCKHEGPSTGGIVTTTLYNVTSEHRLRKIFYTGTLDPDETYYIRFKSILSNTSTMFVLDYVEFAPKTITTATYQRTHGKHTVNKPRPCHGNIPPGHSAECPGVF